MKYVKIIIVIVLMGVLYGQLYYYNKQNIKAQETAKQQNTLTKEMTKEEKIAAKNDSGVIFEKYAFGISQEDFDANILEFAEETLKEIHEVTSGKSEDYISQYFDLHEKEINDMLIYSKEDFIGVAAASNIPFFSKNPEYQGMDIDTTSAKDDEKYLTFDALLNYSTGGNVEIRITISKDEQTKPLMKIEPLIEEVNYE